MGGNEWPAGTCDGNNTCPVLSQGLHTGFESGVEFSPRLASQCGSHLFYDGRAVELDFLGLDRFSDTPYHMAQQTRRIL